jgi:NADH:ubiquinone reductase (H+-translocating)
MNKPKVVILGAGYGGMMTAVNLQKMVGANEVDITLVNKHDYHYLTILLHETSAGTAPQEDVKIPIKSLIDSRKVKFIQDTVVSIDPKAKKVKLENGELDYDYLVVALGFESATFGIKGLEEHALMISNVNNARLIREHIDYNFSLYNNVPGDRDDLITIVIGGAGFTGIEFAGEIANRVPELCREYDIDRSKVRIIVVEAGPTALAGFDPELVEYALNRLEAKGVEFRISTAVKEATADGIIVEHNGEQEEIKTKNFIWAAGVKANPIVEQSGFETNRGKVQVRPDLRTPDYDDVFVVGDCALIMNEETGRPYPPTAQMAMQQGPVAAENLKILIRGGSDLKEFKPNILGTLASLGSDDGMGVVFGGKKLFGWTAQFMKKMSDNRYLLKLGGIGLMLKKGKFNFFS